MFSRPKNDKEKRRHIQVYHSKSKQLDIKFILSVSFYHTTDHLRCANIEQGLKKHKTNERNLTKTAQLTAI